MIKSILPNLAFVRSALWFMEYGSYSLAAILVLGWLTQTAAADNLGGTNALNQNNFFALEQDTANPLGNLVVNVLNL